MKISEQVAELETQAQEATTRAEHYLVGLRAGVRGDVLAVDLESATDRGWREGDRLRRIARMDLEGFRAGVLGETHGDGADPAFVAGYHEGVKVRAEAAVAMWEKIDAANRRALTEALGVEWGSGRSVEEGIRRLSSLEKSWQARCVRGEAEGGPATNAKELEQQLAMVQEERKRLLAEAESRVKVGGNPPEPEIGMTFTSIHGAGLLTWLPHAWPDNIKEVRAPWGGPVVWRRE